MNPLWLSEHLSFNSFPDGDCLTNTNFLLPQVQNEQGIETAVKAIRHYRECINLPFAFETGVNYLKPLKHEIPDGRFVAEIAEKADCNILLDLHNVMTNQVNGRQTVSAFISQLPLHRIMEIHLASGFFFRDYYLDAHSGISNDNLIGLAEGIVRKLPNLKLIVFEMLPEFLPSLSDGDFEKQIIAMRRIWDMRGRNFRVQKKRKNTIHSSGLGNHIPVKDWEYTLGKLCLGQPLLGNDLVRELGDDKGIKIINELIFHFRASAVVSSLKLTTRLLRFSLGEENFNELLKEFFNNSKPDLFPFRVALDFSDFLGSKNPDVPFLEDLVSFEVATIKTISDDRVREVKFSYNPFPVFRSLNNNELPEEQTDPVKFIITIKPDESIEESDLLALKSVLHS